MSVMRAKSGLFYASVHRAGSQRDKSVLVTSRLFGPFPFRRNLFANVCLWRLQFPKAQKKASLHLSTEPWESIMNFGGRHLTISVYTSCN
jgi:hypothetical protein